MANKQLILPANRAFNSNGFPIPGATASLYLSGTLTPAEFYSDSTLSTPLGPVLTANGAGRFELPAYQDEYTPFRLITRDAGGTQLDDIDPFYFGYQGPQGIQGIAGDVSKAATRADIAGIGIAGQASGLTRYLIEAGREGIFVWSTTNLSAAVAADTAQGIHIAPSSDTSGASGAWVRQYDGPINAKFFGAKGDSNATASVGTDDTAAIQAAINYVNSLGGGTLFFPVGHYKITSYLTLCKNLVMLGSGWVASQIVCNMAGGGGSSSDQNVRNGTALYSNWPSNSSISANIVLEKLGLVNSAASPQGAGFYDNCGTYITIRDCGIGGFKYSVIFDQTELADIEGSNLGPANVAGSACVWIVDGSTLKSGNVAGFSNRIAIRSCQIGGGANTYGIHDEGGNSHAIIDCNFNGCLNHIYTNAVFPLDVRGGEFEGAASHCIVLDTPGGYTAIRGGLYTAAAGHSSIHGQNSGGMLQVDGVPEFSGGSGTNAITGSNTFSAIWLLTYSNQTGLSDLKDGNATYVNVDMGANDLVLTAPTSIQFVNPLHCKSGASATSTDSSVAQIYFGYGGTTDYRHAIVSRHNTVLANNALDFYLHNGGVDAQGDNPTLKAMSLDAATGLTVDAGLTITPAASAVPTVNGQVTFELTSNTTLTIRAKGSDGTLRAATVTLA